MEKFVSKVRNSAVGFCAGLSALLMFPVAAFAELPSGVDTKITAIVTDIGSIAALVIGITLAIVSARVLIRMIKAG